jgi:hypothetical protein
VTPVENGFEVRTLNYEYVVKQIQQGALSGYDPEPEANIGHSFIVNEESAVFDKFIAEHIDGQLFDDEPIFRIERIN